MISANSLIGRSVSIQVNDFIDTLTHGQIQFVDPIKKSVVIKLDTPLDIRNIRYEWVVASARLEQDSLDGLISLNALGCGVTWIPNSRFNIELPFDLSWWRGGAAAIADIFLTE